MPRIVKIKGFFENFEWSCLEGAYGVKKTSQRTFILPFELVNLATTHLYCPMYFSFFPTVPWTTAAADRNQLCNEVFKILWKLL